MKVRPRHSLLRSYVLALLCVEVLLVGLHAAFPDLRLVDLDGEHNLPAWFSGLQLAAIAVVALAAFHGEGPGRSSRLVWAVVATAFFCLSFDEIGVVHERVLREETLASLGGATLLRAVPPWQLVYAPAALGAAGVFGYLLASRLAGDHLARCAAPGAFALWGAAFFFEGTAIGVFMPRQWYRVEVALEEFCEMAGATLLLWAVAVYALDARRTRAPARVAAGPLWRGLAAALPLFLLVGVPGAVIGVAARFEGAAVRRSAGEELLEDGRYPEAMEAFALVIAEDPSDIEALRGLGTAAYRAGELARAERIFERALALAPDDELIENALDLLRLKRRQQRE
jgi:hypothetical protein